MTNLKLALAARLAATALALSFTNMIGGLALLQTVALATAFVIGAVEDFQEEAVSFIEYNSKEGLFDF
jgi:hypothetical protein